MIRTLDELTDLEKLSLIEISASRLSKFGDFCQAAYFYDYVLFEPRGTNKYAQLGNVIHSVLEATDFDQPLNYFEMLDLFDDYKTVHDPQGDITDDLIAIGHQILADFCTAHKTTEWHVAAKEESFAVVIGPALVVGYIDRVDEIGNCIIITDYKSGRREVAVKNVPNDFQLGIYALAMKKKYPNHRIIAQLDYLRSGRTKSHEYSDDDLIKMESRLIEAISEIISTDNFKPTANANTCNWCNHAESVCSVGKKRLNKYQ